MENLLKSLVLGETLYTTKNGTEYKLVKKWDDGSLSYSINTGSKPLPIATINTAYSDHLKGIQIDAQWYKKFNAKEYKSRRCNVSVLKSLLSRLN